MAVGVVVSSTEDEHAAGDLHLTAAVWADSSALQERPVMVVHRDLEPGDLADLAGTEGPDVRCALTLGLAPQTRRRLLASLERLSGTGLTAVVDAPVAAFAASPPGPRARAVPPAGPQLHVIALGQPDGQVSLLIADRVSAQLAAIGLVRDATGAQALMRRALLACTPRAPSQPGPHTPDRALEERFSSVTAYELNGSGAELLSNAFGRVPVEQRTPRIEDTCLLGLARLPRLAAWTATWPTGRLHVGDGWTRQAGPLRSDRETHLIHLRSDNAIRFSNPAGRALPIQAGSIRAAGCVIPSRLGTRPQLELCDDGRLLVHGHRGVEPLEVRLRWPIPGSGALALGITGAAGAGVELLDPSLGGPQQVEDIQPELGRQPQ